MSEYINYLFENKKILSEDDISYFRKLPNILEKKKFIDNYQQNNNGLHIYRIIKFNENFTNSLKNITNYKYVKDILDNGFSIIENILDPITFTRISDDILYNNKKKFNINCLNFVNTINILTNQNNKSYSLNLNHIQYNSSYDEQRNLHSDSPYPQLKCWIYINDISDNNGSFKYVKHSNIVSEELLQFYYNFSILKRDDPNFINHTENGKAGKIGSPRIFINNIYNENKILKKLNLEEPTSLNYKKNTLVIANTFGLHKRGFCEKNNERLMLELVIN